jgi:hypothetical protein
MEVGILLMFAQREKESYICLRYLEPDGAIGADGKFRHPRFVRLREDKA